MKCIKVKSCFTCPLCYDIGQKWYCHHPSDKRPNNVTDNRNIGLIHPDCPLEDYIPPVGSSLPKVKKGVETDFTGLPMNPFDSENYE